MQFKYKPLAIGLALSTFAATQAHAQSESLALEEIIVVSSRVPLPLRQTGTSVSVITDIEIEAHGNFALTDVLRQLPGIATSRNGGTGQTSALRIRGEEGFRTLTIFDGIRLQDPSIPQIGPQLEHLLSSGIGRVEVLRGPQGLSYGADAGGIVNISSRQAEEGFNTSFNVQTGSFDTQQYSGNVGAANEKFDIFLSLADYQTEGFNSRSSDSVLQDKDGYENTSIHTKVGFNATEELRFDLVHRNVEGNSMYDACFSGTTVHDCTAEYELNASRISASYSSNNFSHSLSYAETETDRQNFSLGLPAFGATGQTNRLEYVGSVKNLPGFDLVFGADQEEAINSGTGRDNTGMYLEYLSDFSNSIYLTAGVRHDDNDDFGTNSSYRFSGAYLINVRSNSSLKLKGSFGSGFRAPSPYEIAYNSGSFSYPPASLINLTQEESEGYEAGLEYIAGNSLHLEAVYFDQKITDAIYFDSATYSGYLQDTGASTSKGVELSGELQINETWNLTLNYTYNDTEKPNGLQRHRRPEHLANFGASYFGLDGKLNINAFYRISQNAIDEVSSTLVELEDFAVLDLSANYNVTDAFQLYARIENFLDEEYQEIIDYNTAGSAGYVGFRMSFSSL